MPDSNGREGRLLFLRRRRHMTDAMVKGFYEDSLSQADKSFLVRHLLRGCGPCSERMLRIGIESGFLAPSERDSIRELTAESPEIGTRRLLGIAQWAILQSVPASQVAFINEHRDFHHLGFYERLIEVSKFEMRRDPQRAANAARLAMAVAKHLKVPSDLRNDYLATASAISGNALRLSADFAGAEMALNAAWDLRDEGTSDPLVDGLIHRYEGALHEDLGNYEDAEISYNNALTEYESAGDEHLQGRTLLSMAAAALYYDPAKALANLGRAGGLYDSSLEPFLDWCSRHTEVWALNELGKPEAALALLEDSREMYQHFGSSDLWVRLRMYWVEARIAFNLGKIREAEEILAMLFRLLDVEGNHPVELTLVAVDLLHAVAVQEGRHEDVVRFAGELLPLLRALGLHDQGRAIILLLPESLRRGVLDGARWKAVKDYFRRHWHRPLSESPQLA
jgi:tetratricopeptide (TPR) repeat protein